MPVWIAEFLGALLRWALATLTGALVARSIIPQDVADSVVTHGVPTLLAWLLILIPLGLSWLQKWKARKVKLLALEMKPGTSEKELDAEAKKTLSKYPSTGIGVLLLALTLGGGAMLLSTSCSTGGPDGPVIVGTNISQHDAKRALLELQDARVLVLKSVAAIYMTDQGNPKYQAAVLAVDRVDQEFTAGWRLAALAADTWDPVLFLQRYSQALNALGRMKAEVPQ